MLARSAKPAALAISLLTWSLLATAPAALAARATSPAPAPAAIDSNRTSLAKTATGWSTSIGVTSLSKGALKLSAVQLPSSLNLKLCKPGLAPPVIDGPGHETVKVTLDDSCSVVEGVFVFSLTTKAKGANQSFTVTATEPKKTKVDWGGLASGFAAGLAIGLVLALIAWSIAKISFGSDANMKPWSRLTHLPSTGWSFSESIATSVTGAGGLITVLLGTSEGLKSILTLDEEQQLPLLIVGGVVAAALVAVAPLVLEASRRPAVDDHRTAQITVGGLCVTSAITVGSAFGLLWVGFTASREILDGTGEHFIGAIIAGAAALLAWYTLAAIVQALRLGVVPPPTKPSAGADALVTAVEPQIPPSLQANFMAARTSIERRVAEGPAEEGGFEEGAMFAAHTLRDVDIPRDVVYGALASIAPPEEVQSFSPLL